MINIKNTKFGILLTERTKNVDVHIYYLNLNKDDTISLFAFDESSHNLKILFPNKYEYSENKDYKVTEVVLQQQDLIYESVLSSISSLSDI